MGCGSGDYHRDLLDHNEHIKKIVGIEQSIDMLKSAVNTDKCEYFNMDVLTPTITQKFGCVIESFLV
jgi:trans-aconitate methyltransferase